MEIRNRLSDFGIQGYWMSHHPWIVPEPFTPEPCETYSKADLDYWAAAMAQCVKEAYEDPEFVMNAPHAMGNTKILDDSLVEDPRDGHAPTGHIRKREQRNNLSGSVGHI